MPSLARSTLREQALVALRSAILSGQYRPGDHLGEVEIASRMSISRGTVREALRHLQQEGLVTAGMRGMLRVRSLSPSEVRELYRVRGALEGLAITEIIASERRAAAVEALDEALERLDQADSPEARIEADLGFHVRLCELSGNSMLVQSWRHLEGATRIVVMSAAARERELATSADHHRPIVRAIEREDAATALDVLNQHMSAAAERLTAED
ncbi:GntR family transcriptional regulator [Amycolatopsis albispora]|uniref:GntR family transcriptional regulator n=1 Tax=Amycolatopsis albispora TaxID=1804986 RepID=A0A344LKS0_9PSEU|nr:GntR family transcriptional regulator [Amycolatopsis albispora]